VFMSVTGVFMSELGVGSARRQARFEMLLTSRTTIQFIRMTTIGVPRSLSTAIPLRGLR